MTPKLTKRFLQTAYWDHCRTLRSIALEARVAPNTVRSRILHFFGKTRSRGDAMREGARLGRVSHPTRGRELTEEEKDNIARGVRAAQTPETRAALSARGKAQYEAMPPIDREAFALRGREATRQARARGSKLEFGLLEGLKRRGYKAWFRPKQRPGDLFLPDYGTAVFVDGPLTCGGLINPNDPAAAAAKRALARTLGYRVVRVATAQKMVTRGLVLDLLTKIVAVLELTINEDGEYYEVTDERESEDGEGEGAEGPEGGGDGGDGGGAGHPKPDRTDHERPAGEGTG